MSATALIAEDELLLAASLKATLVRLWPELQIVATATHGAAAVASMDVHRRFRSSTEIWSWDRSTHSLTSGDSSSKRTRWHRIGYLDEGSAVGPVLYEQSHAAPDSEP
jgi:hypothetical protein